MYGTIASRNFVAQQQFAVPDPGQNGELHAHHDDDRHTRRERGSKGWDYRIGIGDPERTPSGPANRDRGLMHDIPAECNGHNPRLGRPGPILRRVTEVTTNDAVDESRCQVREDNEGGTTHDAAA